ncbi:MAG: hypothetical protein LBD76_07915 [Prevotellaceae bacterium]|jgi:predicted HTH transcriptional regulator|nr:hypothetical protein [Prevotellaceae bacterium]
MIKMISISELEFPEQVAGYIDKNDEITNYRAQLLTNKSDISVKKHLARFVELGILRVEGKKQGTEIMTNNFSYITGKKSIKYV